MRCSTACPKPTRRIRQRASRPALPGQCRDRGLRGRARQRAKLPQRGPHRRDHLHAQRDRGDQPGGVSWGEPNIKAGDEIVISGMEHHSNIVPWHETFTPSGAAAAVRGRGRARPAQGGEDPAGAAGMVRRWYGALDEERRSRLCCVMSHLAGYLLPALDRPADALVLVREPVDRTLSYWFKQGRRGAGRKRCRPLDELRAEPDGQARALGAVPQLAEPRAALRLPRRRRSCRYSAARLPTPSLARELRDLVGPVYTVGVQDRFEEFVASLAERYGWETVRPAEQGQPDRARRRSSRRSTASRSWPRTGSTPSCTNWRRTRRRTSGVKSSSSPPGATTPTSPASPGLRRRLARLVRTGSPVSSRARRGASSSGAARGGRVPAAIERGQAAARRPVPRRGRLRAPLLDPGAPAAARRRRSASA